MNKKEQGKSRRHSIQHLHCVIPNLKDPLLNFNSSKSYSPRLRISTLNDCLKFSVTEISKDLASLLSPVGIVRYSGRSSDLKVVENLNQQA